MEKPRPSPNLGKWISTRATRPSRSTNEAGSSAGSRRSTSPSGEGVLSLAMRRSLMSVAIDMFLERLDPDAMHDLDEALGFAVAVLQIAIDEALDHVGNVVARERG